MQTILMEQNTTVNVFNLKNLIVKNTGLQFFENKDENS